MKRENAVEIKKLISTNVVKNIIGHHLQSFADNDLEAVIDDYTTESVLITQQATYRGPQEIREFFESLMVHFPKQKSDFQLDKMIIDNDLAYIVWHATTPSLRVSFGTDSFIIREDKIYQQTFAGQIEFIY